MSPKGLIAEEHSPFITQGFVDGQHRPPIIKCLADFGAQTKDRGAIQMRGMCRLSQCGCDALGKRGFRIWSAHVVTFVLPDRFRLSRSCFKAASCSRGGGVVGTLVRGAVSRSACNRFCWSAKAVASRLR